jgi:hypothetical protein
VAGRGGAGGGGGGGGRGELYLRRTQYEQSFEGGDLPYMNRASQVIRTYLGPVT